MYSIDQLFTSRARVELLKLFLMNADREFYMREAAGVSSLPLQAVQRETDKLVKSGLIVRRAHGNRVYFRANRQSPIFEEMRAIIFKTAGLGDVLRQSVQASGKVKAAFIFGSVAAGTEDISSDIDLLVIGSITGRELSSLLAPARETIDREINQITMDESEFRRRLRAKDHFLTTLLEEPKLFLIGDESVLEELTG